MFVALSVSCHVQVRQSLSNVVSCHEVPTITGTCCSSRSPAVLYRLSSNAKYVNTCILSLLNCQCQTTPSLSTLNPFIIRSGYGNTPWVVPPHLMGIMGGPGIGCCSSQCGFMLDCTLTLVSQQTTTTGPGAGGRHRKLVVLEPPQDTISFK